MTIPLHSKFRISLIAVLIGIAYYFSGHHASTLVMSSEYLTSFYLLLITLTLFLWTTFHFNSKKINTTLFITLLTCSSTANSQEHLIFGSAEEVTLSLQFFVIALSVPIILLSVFIFKYRTTKIKLDECSERFKGSFLDAPIGMALVAPDLNIIEANPSLHKMLGYSVNELTGVNFKNITHEDDLQKCQSYQNKLLSGEMDSYQFEKRYLDKQGRIIWGLLNVSLVRHNASPFYSIAQIQNITERKQANELLTFQASHDSLTGLVNRREFERRTKRLLSSIQQEPDKQHALCFMDLDQFKIVNDACGHTAGDEMLRQISSILLRVIRYRDTVARLGGDEFGVLMEYCSIDDAHRVATSLQKAIQDYNFSWEGHTFKMGVSIGLVPIIETIPSFNELLKEADAACYMAKDKGRNRIHVYHANDSEIAKRHGEIQWVERLYQALDEDRFCLYAQTIVSLSNDKDMHYELLLRMIDEKGEMILPDAFLPAAERYNLISRIDLWVIEKTFRLLQDNPDFLENVNFLSINLSGPTLTNSNILDFIIEELDSSGISADKLCFEITETAAISNLNNAMKFISILKDLGCRFALDDFGSGLSSFAYLKNLSVDYLKIDGVFVKDIVDDLIDHAMVKSINEIGQTMEMKTIAEFVENDVIKGMLKEIGVDYVQGYGIGKPQPFKDLL
ncbi:MAG: EAL domain-containing protein [Proteobacteria bacterium]|nr:EAL domain-containing protein [Pseudomonadota bacterium]NOG61764.1 EAL domain-containing protein [Pseudomonadota bacterium]